MAGMTLRARKGVDILVVVLAFFTRHLHVSPDRLGKVRELFGDLLWADFLVLFFSHKVLLSEKKHYNTSKRIECLVANGLIIESTIDFGSYTKLLPAMKKYPDSPIITLDDDVLYYPYVVEKLWNSYNGNKENIHATRCYEIGLDNNGSVMPYLFWKKLKSQSRTSKDLFFT